LTGFPGSRYNEWLEDPVQTFLLTRKHEMRTYLGISFCVVGLYGLVAGRVLPGLLFMGAGMILSNFFRHTRSNPL
jgi:hypothetical protein